MTHVITYYSLCDSPYALLYGSPFRAELSTGPDRLLNTAAHHMLTKAAEAIEGTMTVDVMPIGPCMTHPSADWTLHADPISRLDRPASTPLATHPRHNFRAAPCDLSGVDRYYVRRVSRVARVARCCG